MATRQQPSAKAAFKKTHTFSDTVKIGDIDIIQSLLGSSGDNINFLATSLKVKIKNTGDGFIISGSEREPVSKALKVLQDLRTYAISKSAIITRGNIEDHLKNVTIGPDVERIHTPRKTIYARTENQSEWMRIIKNYTVSFGVGVAGTGKTYVATAMAAQALSKGLVEQIIICRPIVATEDIGYLPGDIRGKSDPYMQPIYDALNDTFGAEKVETMMEKNGPIQVVLLAHMRGRTFHDSFMLLDEAQNTTPQQMKMFLTRIGDRSKAVITGDPTQIDLPKGAQSGLVEALQVFKNSKTIATLKFEMEDVVRSEAVKEILSCYEDYETFVHSNAPATPKALGSGPA